MAKSWIIDGRSIARKVKTSSVPLAHQIKDCGANRECPRCHCSIDNSDVSVEWPGLPFGVKFEPTDVELLEHLAAKCGVGNEEPHQFIDEFIPTLDVDNGICYEHPENLPGARKDGNSMHFFYKTTNAYTTGQRKRRRICNESGLRKDVRWHKTGKTKAVMQNGVQIGCKKIMVLYGAAGGGFKPYKLNWVMHEYHLGAVEDEKEGQYVVSKIFYQPQKQTEKTDNHFVVDEKTDNHFVVDEKTDNHFVVDEVDAWMTQTSPRTPQTDAPDPRRPGKSVLCEDATTDYVLQSPPQESGWSVEKKCLPNSSNAENKDDLEVPIWEDDSQAIDLDAFDDSLFCNENLDTYALLGDSRPNHGPHSGTTNDASGTTSAIADLDNLDMGTPPDFSLSDLQFSSQDSIFGWLKRL